MMRPITRFRSVFAGIAALALAGCGSLYAGSDPTVVNSSLVRSDAYTYIRTAAGHGEMKTKVFGNPFGEDAGSVRSRTVAAMQGHYPGGRFLFTETPEIVDRDIHVTIAFEPPEVLHAPRLCKEPESVELGRTEGDVMNAAAAFCLGNQLMAVSRLRGPNPGSSETAAFDKLIGELTWNVMNVPVIDRDRDCDACG